MKKILLLSSVFLLSMAISMPSIAQERTVSGRVIAQDDRSPIPGVNVVLKGTTNGTTTDANGSYTLTIPSNGGSLVFSFIGLQTTEIAIGERTTVDIELGLDVTQLNEVVVTAFGIEREQKSLGFSVTQVGSKELTQGRTTNIANALTAKVAGVRVQGSNGQVGASSSIFIRGFTTFTGSNQPLFVVDGIPIDNGGGGNALQGGVSNSNRGIDINQDDVESISILKGPAAAVLYGSRAAAGAVIITTKKGSSRKNKNTVSITSNYNIAQVNRLPDYQNEYAQGQFGLFGTVNEVNSWGPKIGGQTITNFRGEQEVLQAYPDNVKDIFRNGSSFQNNISFAGGSDKSDFYLSYGNLSESGTIANNELDRNSLTFNGSTKFNDKFKAGVNIIYTNNRSTRTQQGNQLANPFFRSWFLPRTQNLSNFPFVNPDGTQRSPANAGDLLSSNTWFSNDDNPLFSINRNTYGDEVNRIIGNVNLSYDIAPWLVAAYRIGIDTYSQEFKTVNARTSRGGGAAAQTGAITDQIFNRAELSSYLTLTFNKRFANDNIGVRALVGNEVNQRKTRNNGVEGTDIQIIGLNNITNTLNFAPFGTTTNVRLIGAFADVSVDYKNFLFLGLTGRNDWSSTFGPTQRSYFYPSVTTSFVFTEAIPFFESQSVLTFGKVRANYASVGREAPVFSTDTYYFRSNPADGFGPNILYPFRGQLGQTYGNTGGNPLLGPEFNDNIEFGADLRFFKNRIGLDVNWFLNRSRDVIFDVPVAGASGFTNQTLNVGESESKGWEVLLTGTPVKTANFSWDVSVNWARIRNTVTRLAPGVTQITLGGFVTPSTRLIEGQPYGVLFGSVFQRSSSGELLVDGNGRAQLSLDNQIIGDPNPDWFGGLTNTFTYKGLSLTALLDVRMGGDIISRNISDLRRSGAAEETGDRDRGYIIDGVSADGSRNNIQIAPQDYFTDLYGFGRAEFVTFDASWLRLRELAITYQLPKTLLDRTPFGLVEFGLTGRNLFLYSPNVPHIDPEVNAQGQSNSQGLEFNALPQTRNYGALIRLTF